MVYGFLLVLVMRNIWAILVKQREYKNLPILAFYTYALIAVTLRLVNELFYWTPNVVVRNLDMI